MPCHATRVQCVQLYDVGVRMQGGAQVVQAAGTASRRYTMQEQGEASALRRELESLKAQVAALSQLVLGRAPVSGAEMED
jgi:hypothetical protein